MRALVLAVALAGCAPRAAGSTETLAAAIARAHDAQKPLVVELGAPWCQPCRELAKHVLPDPRVVAALRDVTFVQYETQTARGGEVAEHLGISALPSFIVFDASGAVRASIVGRAPTVDELVALLANAHM